MSIEAFYHCLTLEEWTNVTSICSYSEVKVLYYILAENPMGNRKVDCRVRTVAEKMHLSIGAVSKAIKKLEQKGLIDEVTITRAEISIKPRIISDRAKEFLRKHNPNSEYLEPVIVSPSEQDVSPSEQDVSPSEQDVSPSEQSNIYGSRTRSKNCLEDSKKTVDTGTATSTPTTTEATVEVEAFPPSLDAQVIEPEIKQEEPRESEIQTEAISTQPEATQEDTFSAAADAEILREIERIAHNWKLRPWKSSAQHFKPEILKAVWQCNPGYYSLQGTQVPNQHHILKALQLLERQLKSLDAAAINAYHELMRYWQTAQALANPNVQHAFVTAAAQSKEQIEAMERKRQAQVDAERLRKDLGL